MRLMLRQLFFFASQLFVAAEMQTSVNKVICICKAMYRRQQENQGANCITTCLGKQTLPRTTSFYLSVNMT